MRVGAADESEPEMVEPPDYLALLDEVCAAPGCYLRNGDHSPEDTTACIERWLLALEAER